jgi:hypothetical protein
MLPLLLHLLQPCASAAVSSISSSSAFFSSSPSASPVLLASSSLSPLGADEPDRFPALNALFNNSYAALPAISGNVTKDLGFRLMEVECGNLYIAQLRTNSSAPPMQHFGLDLLDASLDCHGHWMYSLDGTDYYPGTFEAKVADVAFLLAVEGALDAKYHLPANFTVSKCNFTAKVTTSFQGEVVAWILDLLKPVIDAAIDDALHAEVCKAGSKVVDHLINNVTNLVTEVLGPFLDNPGAPVVPDPSPAPSGKPVINFAAVPILSDLVRFVNEGGAVVVNGVVDLLTGGTGTISDLPLGNLTLIKTNGSLINSSLELQSLTITGADSLTVFEALSPDTLHDNSTLNTSIAFSHIGITIRAKLSMWRGAGLHPGKPSDDDDDDDHDDDHGDGPVVTQVIDLSFNLTDASLGLNIWAPLLSSDENGLGSLKLGQLGDLQCWLSKFEALQVLLLAPNASTVSGPAVVQVVGDGELPSDLWAFVEDVLEHVEADYFPAVLSVLPQLSNGVLKTLLNIVLFSAVSGSADACAKNALDLPGYVDFTNHKEGVSGLLWLLDVVVNGVLKASGLDGLIEKLLPGGVLMVNGTLSNTTVSREDYGTAHLDLTHLRLTGLASLVDLVFPKAVADHNLTLAATFDTCAPVSGFDGGGGYDGDYSVDDYDDDADVDDDNNDELLASSNPPLNLSFHAHLDYTPSAAAPPSAKAVTDDFELFLSFSNLALVSNLTVLLNRTRLERVKLGDLSLANLVSE